MHYLSIYFWYKKSRVNSNQLKMEKKMKKNKEKRLPAECISIMITLLAEAIVKILKKAKKGVRSWKLPIVK